MTVSPATISRVRSLPRIIVDPELHLQCVADEECVVSDTLE
jgi:hypothetical protein